VLKAADNGVKAVTNFWIVCDKVVKAVMFLSIAKLFIYDIICF
jgi:hypothetical protein